MEITDNFDQIGQYSNLELMKKLNKLKSNNFQSFFEEYLNKSYKLYKKNKNQQISFMDYQDQLFKELEKSKKQKKYGKN